MHISKINLLITALDLTHEKIARGTGLARSMVTMTIRGGRTNRPTQDKIAQFLKDQISTEALFKIETESKETAQPQQTKGLRSKRNRADLTR